MSDSFELKQNGLVILAMLLEKFDQEREQKVLLAEDLQPYLLK